MSNFFGLTGAQMARFRLFFPKSHGRPRVDHLRVLSGIIFINRWKRWSDSGVFARIMVGLAAEGPSPKTIMTDATNLKAHRTASSLRTKKEGAVARSVEQKVA